MGVGSKRKAWNDAMRSVGSPAFDSHTSRKKETRRDRARKSNAGIRGEPSNNAATTTINEYRIATRIDQLEGVTNVDDQEADEEYDELEGLKQKRGAGVGKKKSKAAKAKRPPSGSNVVPKRFRRRSLASILIEEASLGEKGICQKYLAAEAKPMEGAIRPPPTKFCPVTGLYGLYTDPKTGIPYANAKALEKIRDHPPPWLSSRSVGTVSYFEAVKSLKDMD